MKRLFILKIGTAVTNNCGAMEADTISKNGWSSKSQMSRNQFWVIFQKMKILFFVLFLCIAFCTNSYPQKIIPFFEGGVNFSFISNTSGIDKYYKNFYDDYQKNSIVNFGLNFGYGVSFIEKYSVILDLAFSDGMSPFFYSSFDEIQKKLSTYSVSLLVEYDFWKGVSSKLSLKTGIGYDETYFLYVRNEPLHKETYAWINGYIPIGITMWRNLNTSINAGLFLQYNFNVIKGKTHFTASEVKIPNVWQNSLMFGVKFRGLVF